MHKSSVRWQFSLRAILLAMVVIAVAIVAYQYLFPPPAAHVPVFVGTETHYFQAFGHHYTVEVAWDAIQQTPTWDRRRPHPPLSPNTAIVRANQLRLNWIAKGALPDGVEKGAWVMQSVKLVPADDKHWYWLVSFDYVVDQSGPPNEFLVPVTMDGKVIEPILLPEEPEQMTP